MTTKTELIEALDMIAGSLSGDRNRFGKLESHTVDPKARERVRVMLQKLGAEHGGRDSIDQAVYLARALVAQERGEAKPVMPR